MFLSVFLLRAAVFPRSLSPQTMYLPGYILLLVRSAIDKKSGINAEDEQESKYKVKKFCTDSTLFCVW